MAIISSHTSLLYHSLHMSNFSSHTYRHHHLKCLQKSPRLPARQQMCHVCGKEGNVRPRVLNLRLLKQNKKKQPRNEINLCSSANQQ